MDCGLDYSKVEGLFSKSAGTTGSILEKGRGSYAKVTGRTGTGESGPLDREWIVQTRSSGERENVAAESERGGGGAMVGGEKLTGVS